MTGHMREELGAYVLGALEPSARRAVEEHLDDCHTCRDELVRLSPLPGLLDRLSPEEAQLDLRRVTQPPAATVARAAAADRARLRRSVWRWRVATAAAALVAVAVTALAWSPWEGEPDVIVAAMVPVAADAGATKGTVSAYAWEWGTTVEVDVRRLPDRDRYELWAVSVDGRREPAGAWGPTEARRAQVRGASALARARLWRVEVTDESGERLLTADFSADG